MQKETIQSDFTHLLKTGAYIHGRWLQTNKTYAVTNPANLHEITQVSYCGKEETKKAIQSAEEALPKWRHKTAKERSQILRQWFTLVMEQQVALASLLVTEQGKPLSEGMKEVAYGASYIEWYSEEAKRLYGDVIPTHRNDARILVLKEPVGVVAALTPWNFPVAMLTRKVAPALAAGCTVIVKPAQETPLSANALVHLAELAGVPPGVLNLVSGHSNAIGKTLMASSVVRKISFTGSTETGKLLYRQSADTIKKLSLELGGNAPFIVFDDADLEAAVAGAMASKYRNSGQTCVCANRFYIQAGIYDRFTKHLEKEIKKLKVGDAFTPQVQQGPLINEEALARVEKHVQDAQDKGGIIRTGGKRIQRTGHFYEPTLITNAHIDMRLHQEEIFGPIAACYRFTTEEEVIQLANQSPYGLSSYFYSQDLSRIWRAAEKLESGIVGVNTGMTSSELAPFGGVKESGFGREGSKYGIEDYLNIKYVLIGGL